MPITNETIELFSKTHPSRRLKSGIWTTKDVIVGYIYDIYEYKKDKWEYWTKVQIAQVTNKYIILMFFDQTGAYFQKMKYDQFGLIHGEDTPFEEHDWGNKYILKYAGPVNYKIFQGGNNV